MERVMEIVEEATEYHPFLKLILARMASNPEEFALSGKWRALARQALPHLTASEQAALAAAERGVILGLLHTELMQGLLAGDTPVRFSSSDNTYDLGAPGPRLRSLTGTITPRGTKASSDD